jgi:hypothetical protein
MKKGHKLTDEQRETLSRSHMGQSAWNKGTGGCKRGHDPKLYICPPSGVCICLGCKRENGAKYRKQNQKSINLRGRVARYNMQADELRAMWIEQEGRCAICGDELSEDVFRIDHDHRTGKVRGLLCVSCNTGIGLLKDSQEVLLSAVQYLKENNSGD